MNTKTLTYCAAFLMAVLIFGCQSVSDQAMVDDEGRPCGVVSGTFRGRWWNYHERGQSYAACRLWDEAEADYRKALEQRPDDTGRARTYGMNMVAYFPHRELGICLYHQADYTEAMEELETSLSQETSAKARYYLDQTRKAWIESKNLDHADPEIRLTSTVDPGPTRAFTMHIKGMAKDDTFVKRICINGRDLPIDLGAPGIHFETEVPLNPGLNTIRITVWDICGKSHALNLPVSCDRSGPLLAIESITPTGKSGQAVQVKGYALDPSGIRTLRMNGKALPIGGGTEINFSSPCPLNARGSDIVISAEDLAGNITTAVVGQKLMGMKQLGRFKEDFLLASIETASMSFRSAQGSPRLLADSAYPPPRSNLNSSSPRNKALYKGTGSRRNFALIAGINRYKTWPLLKTAVNDARQLAWVLESRYGFAPRDITLLLDQQVTTASFYDALMTITATMGDQDNLLVYFAGHGKLHPLADDGYWIPVAGQRGDAIWTWIAHSAVHNLISSGAVRGKNIMVITDSCYGGQLSRGGQSGALAQRARETETLLSLSARKSRQIISSGSLEPVADWGRDGHSLFAFYLLKALKENSDAYVSLCSLVNTRVWGPVNKLSGQRPVIGRFKTPMDEDGEFVLHLAGTQVENNPAMALTASKPMPVKPSKRSEPDQPASSHDAMPPSITLTSWDEKHIVFLERAYLAGHVDDQGGVADIRINGRSIMKRSGMTIYFNELARLDMGDNPFVIEAFDTAGNRTRKETHIYRKPPKVDAPIARLSAVMLPYKTRGVSESDIQGALFDYLGDSRRFNLKDLNEVTDVPSPPNGIMADEDSLTRQLQNYGIDCKLTGSINMHDDTLEIRARVVAVNSQAVLTTADVYGEDLDREKIRTLCQGLVVRICRDLPVVEGQVASIRGREIVINRGSRHGMKIGMPLILFNEETLTDPETGESLGFDRYQTATASIEEVGDKLSHARLTGKPEKDVRVGQKVITR